MWMMNRVSMSGSTHRQQNIMCEDYAFGFSVGSATAVAVADGAGTAVFGAKGAMIAAKSVARYVACNFDKLFNSSNIDREKYFIIESVKYQIAETFKTEKIEDYNSTVLCAAECDGRYIALHLGDGIICTLKRGGENIELLSAPMNGLTSKQTYLTGMKNAYMNLRLYKGESDAIESIILFSDGLAGDVFDVSENKPREGFDYEKLFRDKNGEYVKSIYSGSDDFSCAFLKRT